MEAACYPCGGSPHGNAAKGDCANPGGSSGRPCADSELGFGAMKKGGSKARQPSAKKSKGAGEDTLMTLPSTGASAVKSVRPGTPNFLMKLLQILEDPISKGLCEWAEDGKSFYVHDPAEFSKKVLPSYFKHTNFLSFVRQLNMYQFNKIIETKSGLDTQANGVRFASASFIRGCPDLLQAPRAKKKTQPVQQETLNQAMANVNEIRSKQAELERRLNEMRSRTEDVGSAVMAWRQQSQRNQNMINKIMTFLAGMYRKPNLSGAPGACDILALPRGQANTQAPSPMLNQSLLSSFSTVQTPAPGPLLEVVEETEDDLSALPVSLKPTRPLVREADESPTDLFKELVGSDSQRRKLEQQRVEEPPSSNTTTAPAEQVECTSSSEMINLPDIRSIIDSSVVSDSPPDADCTLTTLPTASEVDDMDNLTRTISLGIEDLQWTLMNADDSQADFPVFPPPTDA